VLSVKSANDVAGIIVLLAPVGLGSRLILLVMLFSCLTTQAQSSYEDPPRWEIGGHYTLLNIASDRVGCLGCGVNDSGLGVNLGVNFHRWIGFDSEINFFPDPGVGATNQEGGRITQGLFGVKTGIAKEKWGLFAKVRPGFVSNGKAIIAVSPTSPPFSLIFGRLTHFATDIGGIFEYNVTRRISFRTDLGDSIVRHGSQTFTSTTGNTLTTPSYYRNNLQWSTGIIFRF
jgi:hypothetical protein